MAFTAKDLQEIVKAETEQDIYDKDIVTYVNTCLVDMCESFRKTETQIVTVMDIKKFTDRVPGHLSIVKITDPDGRNYTGGIELSYDRQSVRFNEAGTYIITSIIIPELISGVTDEIEVHDVFKVGIARYAAALYDLMDNDQDPEGVRMKAEAEYLIRKASSMLHNADRRTGQSVTYKRSAVNYYK